MAARTWSRVDPTTLGWPLETRETVWEETPARRATSAMDTRCLRRPPPGTPGGDPCRSPEADETIVGRSFWTASAPPKPRVRESGRPSRTLDDRCDGCHDTAISLRKHRIFVVISPHYDRCS